MTNIEVVNLICEALDDIKPRSDGKSYKEQISFVGDRAGHDFRYAIDNGRSSSELGFILAEDFEIRLKKIIVILLKSIR